jgi:hypothetical protein
MPGTARSSNATGILYNFRYSQFEAGCRLRSANSAELSDAMEF